MKFNETELPGVILIEPDVHRDERGFFLETHHAHKYAEGGIDAVFVQDNHSRTGRGTLRGLHMQLAHPQAPRQGAVDPVDKQRQSQPHKGGNLVIFKDRHQRQKPQHHA